MVVFAERLFNAMSQWKHGLLSCFDSAEICLFTCCFPLAWRVKTRQWIEQDKGIENPGVITDFLLVCCCSSCTLMQEAREVGAHPEVVKAMARE